MRIIILSVEGWTAPAVAMAVGLSRRICQRWVARYNRDGLAGLDDHRGHEPQLPLSAEQEQAFRQRLESGAHRRGSGLLTTGQGLSTYPGRRIQLWRSLPAVYWLLHRLGYSYLRPQAAAPQGGPRGDRRVQTKLARPHPGDRRGTSRQATAGLLSGRVTIRPARDNHQRLGPAGLSSHSDPPDGISVPVGAWGGLPRNGARRRAC